MRQLCQFIAQKKAVSLFSQLKDSKTKNKKANKDAIIGKNDAPWEPQFKKDASHPTSLADLVSSEAMASISTTTSNWLQAHKVTLLECGFQMVGSVKATTKSMGNDISNEDIIDELISTFQGYRPKLV
jgi:hypothetical protein